MSTNQSISCSSTDGSDTTDDEESAHSSGSKTPIELHSFAQFREEVLEAFYFDWKNEVESKHRGTINNTVASTYPNSPQSALVVLDHSVNLLNHTSYSQDSVHVKKCDSTDQLLEHLENAVVEPEVETRSKIHISVLPYELLSRVFRWAVGIHLDIGILGRLSRVCKVFYILAHDPHIWRVISFRLWPSLNLQSKSGAGRNSLQLPMLGYNSWRDMVINRPHLLLDGCYLCRITYVRPGEQIFGCQYRRMHLVVYYRGIRFLSDGRMIMFTSALAPNAVVAALNHNPQHHHQAASNSAAAADHQLSNTEPSPTVEVVGGSCGEGFLLGTYMWCEPNIIICTLKRPQTREKPSPFRRRRPKQLSSDVEMTYDISFNVVNSKRRLHSILNWVSYVIRSTNAATQAESITSLNLNSDHFPACYFSSVRSYLRTVAPEPL